MSASGGAVTAWSTARATDSGRRNRPASYSAALVGDDGALHVGVGAPGIDGRDADAVRALLGAQGVGEGAERELARRVGAPARAGGQPGSGVDADDVAAGGAQRGQQEAGEFGDGDDVDLEGLPPLLGRAVLDGAEGTDAGGVDEHVEAVDAGDGVGEGARIGELDGPFAGAGQVGGDGLERVGVAAAEQEVVGGRQGLGDGGADAPGGAGDQREGTGVGCDHAATVPRRAARTGRRLSLGSPSADVCAARPGVSRSGRDLGSARAGVDGARRITASGPGPRASTARSLPVVRDRGDRFTPCPHRPCRRPQEQRRPRNPFSTARNRVSSS